MWEMDTARFWRLTVRLPAYAGAVAAKANEQKESSAPMARTATPTPGPSAYPGARVIGATAAELKASDIGDLFSIGHAGG
jgi:hypothetical protein